MALLPVHKYFIIDKEIKLASDFIASENEGGIYEVVRIEKRVPLFLNEHLKRFSNSAQLAGKKIPFSDQQITTLLINLIEINNVDSGNVLISYKTKLKVFFIAHKYPEEIDYRQGVPAGILVAQRQQPNAKVFQTKVRQLANELIAKNNYYEVILINRDGLVTEGSRSNVFFIQKNRIVTSPLSVVLCGITRQKTVELIKELNYNLVETEIYSTSLKGFESAFITGTSPQILPLKSIGEYVFNPQNKILQNLISEYNNLVLEYVNRVC